MSDRKTVYGDGTLTKIAFSDHARNISGQTQQTIITVTNQGPQGAAGDSVQSLEPRIVALEENTDGLVGGATPLSYYILARGN